MATPFIHQASRRVSLILAATCFVLSFLAALPAWVREPDAPLGVSLLSSLWMDMSIESNVPYVLQQFEAGVSPDDVRFTYPILPMIGGIAILGVVLGMLWYLIPIFREFRSLPSITAPITRTGQPRRLLVLSIRSDEARWWLSALALLCNAPISPYF